MRNPPRPAKTEDATRPTTVIQKGRGHANAHNARLTRTSASTRLTTDKGSVTPRCSTNGETVNLKSRPNHRSGVANAATFTSAVTMKALFIRFVVARSVGEDRQLPRLNQPLVVALDEPVFGPTHRGRGHLALFVTTHGLPVRLVQGLARLRKRDAHVADDVIQVPGWQSLCLVVV